MTGPEELRAAAAAVADRWRRLTPRGWSQPAPGDQGSTRADLAYELCLGWTGGRPLPRPAHPGAYPDLLVVLAEEQVRAGADLDEAARRLAAYARAVG